MRTSISGLALPFVLLAGLSGLAVLALGCQPSESNRPSAASVPGGEREPRESDPRQVEAPSTAELSNATFRGVHEYPVALTEGRWEGEPFVEGGASRPTVGLVADFRLLGDLDGNGSEEAVALLWTSSGGSGTFEYLAVMTRRDGAVVNLATAELGDRVKLRSSAIEAGHIVIETVEAGPQDALCCPGQRRRRAWVLEGDSLIEVANEDLGRVPSVPLD